MPHIEIYHYPRVLSDSARANLSEAITGLICEQFEVTPEVVSIALTPVEPGRWQEQVCAARIAIAGEGLLKAPGYIFKSDSL